MTEEKQTDGLLDEVDCVVAADLLYEEDVSSALGQLLGDWVSQKDANNALYHLVVVDPSRRSRDAFLQAFRDASGKDAFFEEVHVDSEDVFDGSSVFCGCTQM